MLQKKILVPLRASEKSLKGVHHALALAGRLGAMVYILQEAPCMEEPAEPVGSTLEETLRDLINSAREAGLTVSHHLAAKDFKEEIVDMTREEGMDLLVFEANHEIGRLVDQVRPLVACQIFQVGEKDVSEGVMERFGRGFSKQGPAAKTRHQRKEGVMEDPIRILVIDDEPIVGERLKAVLVRDGHRVETFINPLMAMDRLKETDFDIVITDIRMGEMDGIQVLEKVFKKSRRTRVIMISGYATLDLAKESLTKGAFDFIAKPFKLKELRTTIKKAIQSLDRDNEPFANAASA